VLAATQVAFGTWSVCRISAVSTWLLFEKVRLVGEDVGLQSKT